MMTKLILLVSFKIFIKNLGLYYTWMYIEKDTGYNIK